MIHVVDCVGMVTPVVMCQVIPSKLYGVVCNHIHVSFALVMFNVPVIHSYQELLLNVKIGEVLSQIYAFSAHVTILLEVSCTLKVIFNVALPTIPVT
jgi:hypothetical protein